MEPRPYTIYIEGFDVNHSTHDDMLEWDGKGDEVFYHTAVTKVNQNGAITYRSDDRSPVMGDTNAQQGRIQAGSKKGGKGGLQSGDHVDQRVNLYSGFVGEGDVIYCTPTIWEWDTGDGFIQEFIDWHAQIDDKFGERARGIFSKIYPPNEVIFQAVSLGIQTLEFFTKIAGDNGSRPIGMTKSGSGFEFNPHILQFTQAGIEEIRTTDSGRGWGKFSLDYSDDNELEGSYQLHLGAYWIPPGW